APPTPGTSRSAPPAVAAPWDVSPAAGLGAPVFSGPADQVAGGDSGNVPRASIPAPASPIQPQSYATAPSFAIQPVPPACVVSGGRVVALRLPDADGRTYDFTQ